MKFTFLISLLLIFQISFSQNRFGIYYAASNSAVNKWYNLDYTISAYNNLSQNSYVETMPFYGKLAGTYSQWDYFNYGIWYLLLQKKRLGIYGELNSTAMGHKTVYDGGLSDIYPYPLLGPLPSGQNITIENKITLRMLSIGVKAEFRINKFLNAELTPMYCIVPKHEPKWHFFYREFDFSITGKEQELAGGGDVYYDTNNKGIINLKGGINCNLSNKFKLHLLYFKTVNSATKYSKDAPFNYKVRYQGLNIQISYNFLDPNKE